MTKYLLNTLQSEFGRVLLSVLIIALSVFINKIAEKAINGKDVTLDKKRRLSVINKNIIGIATVLALIFVWVSTITNVAISLAAIGGAILIVSKEAIMCFYGYLTIAGTKPFSIGDHIEINSFSGKVIDYNFFTTTLAIIDVSSQLTGKITIIPNSIFLANPCTNHSKPGEYSIEILKISIPAWANVVIANDCAQEAANQVTAVWQEAANAHLESVEEESLVSLPSARPRIIWNTGDGGKFNVLNIRYTCPADKKVDCEQLIFLKFWELFYERQPKVDPKEL